VGRHCHARQSKFVQHLGKDVLARQEAQQTGQLLLVGKLSNVLEGQTVPAESLQEFVEGLCEVVKP
jgi:UDP-2,3-diacylglucosamine pyrophosphatase LpxH